jgi:hypothetical protein
MTQQTQDQQTQTPPGHGSTTSIHLTAKLDNGKVTIEADGSGNGNLPKGSPPHRFTFHLTDETNLNVRFCPVGESVLDVDESQNCPPRRGINTDQVDPQKVHSTDKLAAFTDENSGPPRTLSYALNFKCDDQAQKPQYDPIIINGGSIS